MFPFRFLCRSFFLFLTLSSLPSLSDSQAKPIISGTEEEKEKNSCHLSFVPIPVRPMAFPFLLMFTRVFSKNKNTNFDSDHHQKGEEDCTVFSVSSLLPDLHCKSYPDIISFSLSFFFHSLNFFAHALIHLPAVCLNDMYQWQQMSLICSIAE